jgi:pathogenesis-related protein 1
MLAAHNAVRAHLGIPPLEWSGRLADQAQSWANRLLTSNRFAHRADHFYGENLFEIAGASASPEQVVDAWAAESRDYDYAANRCRKVCGHYTQLVWATTKAVGCGVARNSRREIWVCNYDPPGNYVGKRPY